jgi:hypothetical protein
MRNALLILSIALFQITIFITPLNSETIEITASDVTLSGTAAYLTESKEYRLTQDTHSQLGRVTSKITVCAKEYKIHFEAMPGTKSASQGGGAGLLLYEYDAVTGGSLGIFIFNIQDTSRPSRFNTIEMFHQNTPSFAPPLFSLTGNGWHQVTFHVNEGVVSALVVNENGSVSVANKRNFTPGNPIYHQFLGWTGSARNTHMVRNPEIEIIRHDNCGGEEPMTLEETLQYLETTCGNKDDCSTYDEFQSCAMTTLKHTRREGNISHQTQQTIETEILHKSHFCSGMNQCTSETEHLMYESFQEGYNEGYHDGYANGYEDGFTSGFDSAPTCNERPNNPPFCVNGPGNNGNGNGNGNGNKK